MEVRPASLAVILVWDDGFIVKSHAAAVLPDMAVVALHEEIAHVFCEGCRAILLSYSLARTWVVGMTTYASCDVVFNSFVVIVVDGWLFW